MIYRKVPLVTDAAKNAELARSIDEINHTFQTHGKLLAKRGVDYAQAIVDDVFDRMLPHRAYRVTCKMAATGVVVDLEEPVEL